MPAKCAPSRGRFITLEGGEGVGKSTNLVFIRDYLVQCGIKLVTTREPGGTGLAEQIRHWLLNKDGEAIAETTELLLMFAARAQHLKHVIEPALARGEWVLCDRFTDATYAYQGGGRKMNMDTIAGLEALVQGKLSPDLTLLLDTPIEIGLKRARIRGESDRFEAEQHAFFERVRQAYLHQAARHADRIRIIRADRTLTDVQNDIIASLKPFLESTGIVSQ